MCNVGKTGASGGSTFADRLPISHVAGGSDRSLAAA